MTRITNQLVYFQSPVHSGVAVGITRARTRQSLFYLAATYSIPDFVSFGNRKSHRAVDAGGFCTISVRPSKLAWSRPWRGKRWEASYHSPAPVVPRCEGPLPKQRQRVKNAKSHPVSRMALAQGRLRMPKAPGVCEGPRQADLGLSLERSNLFILARWRWILIAVV